MTAVPVSVAVLLDRLAETHQATGGQPWSATVPGMVHADPAGRTKGRYVATVEHPADAAAIVAAHNHLPALIAAVRAVLALADEWEGKGYSAHLPASLRSAVASALDGNEGPQ